MRILGIDYGAKRVGIAVSDEKRQFALPLSVIINSPILINEIDKIAKDNEVKEIVLGESKNYKGKDNEIMLEILDFKNVLEERGFTVHMEPEFLTSLQVERLQGHNDMKDASAAAIICRVF
jgi:putative holliday junction resolvase